MFFSFPNQRTTGAAFDHNIRLCCDPAVDASQILQILPHGRIFRRTIGKYFVRDDHQVLHLLIQCSNAVQNSLRRVICTLAKLFVGKQIAETFQQCRTAGRKRFRLFCQVGRNLQRPESFSGTLLPMFGKYPRWNEDCGCSLFALWR